MFNIVIGIAWQIALVALPLYVVIHEFARAGIALGTIVITSAESEVHPGMTTWPCAR